MSKHKSFFRSKRLFFPENLKYILFPSSSYFSEGDSRTKRSVNIGKKYKKTLNIHHERMTFFSFSLVLLNDMTFQTCCLLMCENKVFTSLHRMEVPDTNVLFICDPERPGELELLDIYLLYKKV